MEIRSFAVEELGNTSYLLLVPEAGQAVAVDPPRDVDRLLEAVEVEGLRLSWALETHVHNDFVSGCRELAAAVRATVGASSGAALRFPYQALQDGQELEVGPYRLRVLATPGHTPEHVSYLLVAGDAPLGLFSGGSLMVGTAARPDLLGPAESWRLAASLRRTLRERLLPLPQELPVLPTHGGGSFCASGSGGARTTTIGEERRSNPLALAPDERRFVALALDQVPYPSYFDRMRALNQSGAPLLGRRLPEPRRLGLEEFDAWLAQGAAILDLRPAAEFSEGHLPGSYAVGVEGGHSSWVGWLLPPERPLLLVSDDPARERESVRQLARIGYDHVAGVLDGGPAAWAEAGRPLRRFRRQRAAELERRLLQGERLVVVDVRERHEWFAGHVPGSLNLPLHDLPKDAGALPRGPELAVHCGHAYRGTLGASLLEQLGYGPLTVIEDGYTGWARLQDSAKGSR
jgi:hydroxyacylglutathione hydrolase